MFPSGVVALIITAISSSCDPARIKTARPDRPGRDAAHRWRQPAGEITGQERHYVAPEGQDLFARWLDRLRDKQAQARVAARLIRLQNGNFGDCKPAGSGVWELRVDWGPGYRIYYAIEGKRVVLLCDAGDKRTQSEDISRAIDRWNEWQVRRKK